MSLLRGQVDDGWERAAMALGGFVPFFAYVASASGFGFWLDAGEVVAAAVDLDIMHPPGHPLAALLSHAFVYLPFGPIPFRVAIGQALCAAAASVVYLRALLTTLRAQGVVQEQVLYPLALGACWAVVLSYPFALQAIRPEVYALQALLIAWPVERVIALEARWPTRDPSPCVEAAFGTGLGLVNHHFMTILTVPAILPTFFRVRRAHGLGALYRCAAAMLVALVFELYLPIRAKSNPPMNLGDPEEFENFLWVISARAFHSTHALDTAPFFDRLMAVLVAIVEGISWPGLFLALLGAYALLRMPGVRRIGMVWVALGAFCMIGRAFLGFVPNNPDALGYLVPALMAVGALAASAVAVVGHLLSSGLPLRGERQQIMRALPVVLAWSIAAVSALQLRFGVARASLRDFIGTEVFDGPRCRDLPTHSVVIAYNPQTIFRIYECQSLLPFRRDISLVPMPFLGYPKMAERLVQKDQMLSGLLRGVMIEGRPRLSDLQSLSAQRPLFIELDPRLPMDVWNSLVPWGLWFRVESAEVALEDVLRGARTREAMLARIYLDLGSEVDHIPETRAQLLWIHYMDALFFARVGALEASKRAIERGLRLAPLAKELRALKDFLEKNPSSPIDVRPFMVGIGSSGPQ
ncbi:MAG: DUF2723 domain-containing protein [Sandaracinaceae bacterium]|nr:DUF2723 domain-containing protein [Sandaracinaceae bacterium]